MRRKLILNLAVFMLAMPAFGNDMAILKGTPTQTKERPRTVETVESLKPVSTNQKPSERLPTPKIEPLPQVPADMSSENTLGLMQWLDETALVIERNGGETSSFPRGSFNTSTFLSLSFAPDRSNSAPLGGSEFAITDPAYIFLDGLSAESDGTFVIFSLNGAIVEFDPRAPFDAGGTASDGSSIAIEPAQLRPGINTAAAFVISPRGFGFTFAIFRTNEGARLLDVADNAGLTILVDAVEAAGLTDALNGDGPFTVLAPTNDAFIALLADLNLTAEELFANTDLLTEVLTYHVIPNRFTAAELAASAPLATLEGTAVNIEATDNGFVINPGIPVAGDVDIILEDVRASNGIAQVINKVLLPPKNLLETADDAGLTILVDAVEAAGLTDVLNQPGPFTVFAPTNDAFLALLADLNLTAEELFANTELLTTVLLYHVIPGNLSAAELANGAPFTTAQGALVNVIDDNGNFVVNPGVAVNGDVDVVLPNVRASNGQAQVINTVLLPPENLLDTAASAGLTILVDAVEAAGLTDALNTEAQTFTVFAPTNDAFIALLANLELTAEELFADTDLLTTVLLYHVVSPVQSIDAIVLTGGVGTLEGTRVDATRDENGVVKLNGTISVLAEDVLASNGFAQVIDGVLLPAMNPEPQLSFGRNPDGSDAQALNGTTIDARQTFFIYLTPLEPQNDVSVVFFALNGSFISLDTQAPFFLNDFLFDNVSLPVNTAQVNNGINIAIALIQQADGTHTTVVASFEVTGIPG